MIVDRLDEIIDSNPDSVWNTRKINKAFDALDTAIGTTIDTQLLKVNGTQTIQGQKTFTNLYVSDTSGLSYESAMSFLQNDISPVINTGAKGISTDISKELSFTKDNISGVVVPVAELLPVYRKSTVEIRWGISGSSTVEYDIKNIPVYTTSGLSFQATNGMEWPLSQANINRQKYVSSVSASGTIVGGTEVNFRYGVGFFVYLNDNNQVGVALASAGVGFGSKFPLTGTSYYISNTSASIKAFARAGLYLSRDGAGDTNYTKTQQFNFNNTINFLNSPIVFGNLISTLNKYSYFFGESVICSVEMSDSNRLVINRRIIPSVSSSNPILYNYGTSGQIYYGLNSTQVDVPLIINPLTGIFYNSAPWNTSSPDGFSGNGWDRVRRIVY